MSVPHCTDSARRFAEVHHREVEELTRVLETLLLTARRDIAMLLAAGGQRARVGAR